MASSSGSDQAQTNDRRTQPTAPRQEPPTLGRSQTHRTINAAPKADPWTPIVLSLDGGGVRGLSTLFLIRRIMERVADKLAEDPHDPIRGILSQLTSSFTSSIDPIPEAPVEDAATNESDAADKTPKITMETLSPADVSTTEPNGSTHTRKTQETHQEVGRNAYINNGDDLPLPCYFFDLIVGTSTGGLIATMLGLLRMNIDECIMEYWRLNNYIFRPSKLVFPYDARKLEKAIKSVVLRYCHCHKPGEKCTGDERLRQYDYYDVDLDDENTPYSARNNRTCRVGLVSQRKDPSTDLTYLWRSYNHSRRYKGPTNPLELNPREISSNSVRIWEAARASTAAPFYFSRPMIGSHRHMDGGVGNNNPSDIAFREAGYMSLSPTRPGPEDKEDVGMMVSLGTGQHGQESRFGNWKLFKFMRRLITNTEAAHENTREMAKTKDSIYYRFTVPRVGDTDPGLSTMKLSACEESAKTPWWRKVTGASRSQQPETEHTAPQPLPEWYQNLQREARESHKGGYKPDKYDYPTFDKLFEKTRDYYEHGLYYPGSEDDDYNTSQAIDKCADQLIQYAKSRRENNPERWKCFVSHPHPKHPMFLASYLKPTGEP